MIYHLVPQRTLRTSLQGGYYRPASLAQEGFIHCSLAAAVLPVANDYFGNETDQLLLLQIDPAQLTAPVKYEAPSLQAGAGTDHLNSAPLFPHVYGPIELAAVARIGILDREQGHYRWPTAFVPGQAFLVQLGGSK